jgi:hypothetical protein
VLDVGFSSSSLQCVGAATNELRTRWVLTRDQLIDFAHGSTHLAFNRSISPTECGPAYFGLLAHIGFDPANLRSVKRIRFADYSPCECFIPAVTDGFSS